jgi:hypothetical protein
LATRDVTFNDEIDPVAGGAEGALVNGAKARRHLTAEAPLSREESRDDGRYESGEGDQREGFFHWFPRTHAYQRFLGAVSDATRESPDGASRPGNKIRSPSSLVEA